MNSPAAPGRCRVPEGYKERVLQLHGEATVDGVDAVAFLFVALPMYVCQRLCDATGTPVVGTPVMTVCYRENAATGPIGLVLPVFTMKSGAEHELARINPHEVGNFMVREIDNPAEYWDLLVDALVVGECARISVDNEGRAFDLIEFLMALSTWRALMGLAENVGMPLETTLRNILPRYAASFRKSITDVKQVRAG